MTKLTTKWFVCALMIGCSLWVSTLALAGPSLNETTDAMVTRFYAELDKDTLASLDHEKVLTLITPEEREVLASQYWSFDVNVPVVVSVIRNTDQKPVPFWMEESGFRKTDMTMRNTANWPFEVWQKKFGAGRVELGVNGFGMHRTVYFVSVGAQKPGAKVEISKLFPADEAVIEMRDGAWMYRDWDDLYLKDVPESLKGQRLLTTYRGRAREAHFVGAFRSTPLPSSKTPDQVTLTWSEDPKTTQTIQWRTSPAVKTGIVRYRKKSATGFAKTAAAREVIEDRLLVNDRYIHHFTAVLRRLEPGTAYVYSVGSPDADTWSEEAEFTTAPGDDEPFSFICFADTHYSGHWSDLLESASKRHPETAFYLIAGDVVSTGLHRQEWDLVLDYGRDVFNCKPLIYGLGNHDDQDGLGAWLPLALFAFPEDGPDGVEAERTFSFRYGNALFLVLDVGTSHEVQAQWMDEQLAKTDATWKFVVFHFPIYSVEEDYTPIRRSWSPIFDKHHVDMVFHGHVHYYLRTKPMRDGKPVASPKDGTIYTISIALPERQRPQKDAEHVDVRFTGTAVYPRVDINGNRLHYRAYDIDGVVRDELVIEK